MINQLNEDIANLKSLVQTPRTKNKNVSAPISGQISGPIALNTH